MAVGLGFDGALPVMERAVQACKNFGSLLDDSKVEVVFALEGTPAFGGGLDLSFGWIMDDFPCDGVTWTCMDGELVAQVINCTCDGVLGFSCDTIAFIWIGEVVILFLGLEILPPGLHLLLLLEGDNIGTVTFGSCVAPELVITESGCVLPPSRLGII